MRTSQGLIEMYRRMPYEPYIPSTDCPSKELGDWGENHVLTMLKFRLGLKVIRMPVNAAYDLDVQGLCVDVKTSFQENEHHFHLGSHDETDLYILVLVKHEFEVFTIPASFLEGQENITLTYPGKHTGWRQFAGWRALQEAVKAKQPLATFQPKLWSEP